MIRNAMLASRFLNRPLMLLPAHSALLFEMIRSGTEPVAYLPDSDISDRISQPFQRVDNLAIIPIRGMLTHGTGWFWWGGGTSYDTIREAFTAAVDDPTIDAIALHVDSPGGEVAGCFDLADVMLEARGIKPITAIVDEASYSAAYALSCAADEIILTKTAGTGSIGVLLQHTSIVGMLEKVGIEVTTFTYGDYKADSYPTSKMTDGAAARIQSDIDILGEMFIDTVARNRDLAASKIRDMQAGTFLGAGAVTVGLADAVKPADAAFADLLDQIS